MQRAKRFVHVPLHLVVNDFVCTQGVRCFRLLPSFSKKQGWQTTAGQEVRKLQTSRQMLNFSCPPRHIFGARTRQVFPFLPQARPQCERKDLLLLVLNYRTSLKSVKKSFFVSWHLYFVKEKNAKTKYTRLFMMWASIRRFGSNKLTCSSALPVSFWKVCFIELHCSAFPLNFYWLLISVSSVFNAKLHSSYSCGECRPLAMWSELTDKISTIGWNVSPFTSQNWASSFLRFVDKLESVVSFSKVTFVSSTTHSLWSTLCIFWAACSELSSYCLVR